MFKAQYKRSFVVNKHHKQMFEALQDVVDGKCSRLIINMPPRYSKCMHPDTQVYTPRGLITIKDLRPGDKVYSYENGHLVEALCQGTEPAYKESVKVTMRSGRSFICSTDHPMLTPFGYTQVGMLKKGDRLRALHADTMLNKKAISLVDTFPFEIIRHEKLTYQVRKYGIRCQPHKNISREKFNRLAKFFPQLNKYIDKDFYYDTIESVENVGMQELVHLGVDRTHNFIANGLVSHNTEVVVKSFISWGFALNATCRFLHLSYSDMLVNDNSNTVRQIMMEPLYTNLFPNSALEKEKGSSNRWKTKAGGELYAVSTQGQVTGFGAGKVDEVDEDDSDPFIIGDETLNAMLNQIDAKKNIFQGAIIIDDPLKPEDALSDVTRERVNQRFENTIRNRVNSRNTPIIIIMQRLHEHDLCGYLMEKEPDKWRVLSLPALSVNEEGEEVALWPLKHTVEELHELRALDPLVFDTQYMQDPTPKEGLMYSEGFGTYKPEQLLDIIRGQKSVSCNYTDTADTGADNLCSICFIDTPEYAYVTDVLFTDEPMEYTEPATARMLTRNKVKKARIESNNGGRGFARNVQRLLKTANHNYSTRVEWFSQTKNKFVRIFSYSAMVQNTVLFPEGWEKKWPKFHSALMGYRKDNRARTQHDDAPDCLTGVVEMKERSAKKTKIHRRN